MSSDPFVVTMEQVKQCFAALGLDPDAFGRTQSVEWEPGQITVKRMRHDEKGHAYVTGWNEVATETITISVRG